MLSLKSFFTILTLAAVAFAFVHPYHLSVTTIKYVDKENKFKIITKAFYHDLEPSVIKFTGKEFDIKNHKPISERDSLIEIYFKKNLNILINNDTLAITSAKIYFKDEYLFYEKEFNFANKNIQTIDIINTLCYNTEKNQIHLFHYIHNDKKITKKIVYPNSNVNF